MCGVAGIVFSGLPKAEARNAMELMTDRMVHRGPDCSDVWVDPVADVALGHRRLSILDLSERGLQPMHSRCGRYVITYNGEVYNHLELRNALVEKGHSFQGTSDTETILAAISQWGVIETVSRCLGMFAFGLWDKERKELSLVRDRMGIKPLYYGVSEGVVLFASDLSAITAFPGFSKVIDRDALTQLFRHNYIPTPHCIYKGMKKLKPGTRVRLSLTSGELLEESYWDTRAVWLRGMQNPHSFTEAEALDELEYLLTDAVKKRMLADVPVGAFLSGGIDSSLITAIMQKVSTSQVKTFCLGFQEEKYDESREARAVARHLGTDHVEEHLSFRHLIDDIPNFPQYWSEPFSDCGVLTAHMVSKLARKHVTVSLSGDGGDELFTGYERYFHSFWDVWKFIPAPLCKLARWIGEGAQGLKISSAPEFIKLFERLQLVGSRDFAEYYKYIVSHHKRPASLVLGASEPLDSVFRIPDGYNGELLDLKPMWDLTGYLHDGVLTKVDRASMAESLEVRVPLLDHRLVEFAAGLPRAMKVNGGGKYLLRKLLYKYVPPALVERPKMGFGVPLDLWLKKELRSWAEDLLDESLVRRQGILDPIEVRGVWDAFLKGLPGGEYRVWDILMFQTWMVASETNR